MSWNQEVDIAWIVEQVREIVEQVRPPEEESQGFDDRWSYGEAIKYAKMQIESGRLLLEALQERFGGEDHDRSGTR